MYNYLIDTHAHLDFEDYSENFAQIIGNAEAFGVKKMIIPSVSEKSFETVIEIAQANDGIYCAIGLHPTHASEFGSATVDNMLKFAQHKKVVAIGECGLDYYWQKDDKELQKEVFIKQIEVARKLDKTLIVHDRDAHKDTFDTLSTYAQGLRVVMHCFSGSVAFARECVKKGFYIALGGVVTFKNAKNIHEVAIDVPLENLLLETDCPFLTPVPHRGGVNEPAYIKYVAQQIADLKGVDFDVIQEVTTQNALEVFQIG